MVGSPPPTRGLHYEGSVFWREHGITPAYAGTTRLGPLGPHGQRDHPRLRGDYNAVNCFMPAIFGSPPPTRGLHTLIVRENLFGRITPAYAGTTRMSPWT